MITKAKQHQEYFLKDGTKVPGVTTVLSIIAKLALAPAANKLGLLGINSTIHWRGLANIGTIAHYLILCHLKKINPDTSEYHKSYIDKAENSFLSYLEWEKNHKIEPVLLETPLVSEWYRYGGTPDCICHLDGKEELTLLDYKSGRIYKEHYWQIAAYAQLLIDTEYCPNNAIILGIPRTVDDSFDEKIINDPSLGWHPFLAILGAYNSIKDYENQIKEKRDERILAKRG